MNLRNLRRNDFTSIKTRSSRTFNKSYNDSTNYLNSSLIESINYQSKINVSSINQITSKQDSMKFDLSNKSKSILQDLTIDEKIDLVSEINEPMFDENIENLANINQSNQKQIKINSKLDDQFTEINKKRKLSNVDDKPNKRKVLAKKEVLYLFFEIQLTGYSPHEEIIKLSIIDKNNSNGLNGFVIPKKKMTIKMIKSINNIEIGNRIFLVNDEMCDVIDIKSLLIEFVNYLESKQSDNIILVYENQFNLQFIIQILINNLRKYDLIDRVESMVAGFIDCGLLFSDQDCRFALDLGVDYLNIKSKLKSSDPLYRLDLLQKFFYRKSKFVDASQDKVIVKFEKAKNNANDYLNDNLKDQIEIEIEEDTLEKIFNEIKIINETKNYLTSVELRNLYLLQKLKYQYINSRTFKPKKKFPNMSLSPRKKQIKTKSNNVSIEPKISQEQQDNEDVKLINDQDEKINEQTEETNDEKNGENSQKK